MTQHMDSLEEFTDAYVDALLWSSSDDDISACEYELSDLALALCCVDCFDFYTAWAWVIHASGKSPSEPGAYIGPAGHGSDAAMAGHDFALSRNGHGVGFWEADRWHESAGYQLDNACQKFGEVNLYVNDDNELDIE